MSYYFDTSALVKVYHTEAGSSRVQQIYRGNDEVVISELATVECLSTVHRKYREREISHATLSAIIARFKADVEQRYSVLRFSFLVVSEAQDMLYRLAKTSGLKTLDSLQFAFFSACWKLGFELLLRYHMYKYYLKI